MSTSGIYVPSPSFFFHGQEDLRAGPWAKEKQAESKEDDHIDNSHG
jgi:hypothetical protein